MNNNKLCPSCRHPLTTNTCRRCGYKTQTLQVVDTQQEFGRLQHGSRIRKRVQDGPRSKVLTKEEKLSLYLREYQQLIKEALAKLLATQQLQRNDAEQCRKEVKALWQSFLLRKSQTGSPTVGMFWKYLTNSQQIEAQKDIPQPKEEKSDDSSKEEEVIFLSKKRGRPPKSAALQAKQFSKVTQLRCYYNVSVKPLIVESIQARKISAQELTSAQKSFLSYLLALKELDEEMLKVATTKYINLLLAIHGFKQQKSYVKDTIVEMELKRRKAAPIKKKQHSILLILLIDLLKDWTLNYGETQTRGLLRPMLNEYQRSLQKSAIVDRILGQTRKESKEEDPNVPTLTFQFVYSLIYTACIKAGLTLTVGEVITGCGPLQIKKIQIEDDLFLPGVPNEEAISSERVRKGSHLLAHYMKLSFPLQLGRWSVKWCHRLDLMSEVSRIEMINNLLFSEAKQKLNRGEQKEGKNIYYKRYCQLEQDIASMAGVIVFIKLSHGLTDYPFLLHTKTDQLEKYFSFEGKQFEALKRLIKDKAVTVKKQNGSIIKRQIPEIYREPFPIQKVIRRVNHLNFNDKQIGINFFNAEILCLRNLSDLNRLSSSTLLEWTNGVKEKRRQQVKLRYGEVQHVQWINELNRRRKISSVKAIPLKINKDVGELSQDMKNQLGCVIDINEELTQEETMDRESCLLDEPCANYELMYEYSGDNMCMAQRKEQLFLLEGLCFNYCSFVQLVGWLSHYQSVLKCFEDK